MARTVLVTGAAGFIGSHLSEALLARGDRVVGLDDFNDYYDPARKRSNVAEVLSDAPRGCFTLIEGDLRDAAQLDAIFDGHGIEAVAHLGAMGGVRASMEAPDLYVDVNLTGTLRVLDAVRRHRDRDRLANVVFASTSSVYGPTKRIPFVESDPADRPLAPYPATKRAAELLGHSYSHLYGLDFLALRFFTVYGPRGRPDMMPFKLLESSFRGTEVPLYNDGEMWRDWTYVSDVVAGIVAALDRRMGFRVLNIGRGEPQLLKDFVAEVERCTGKTPNLKSSPAPAADMTKTFADITGARELLAYAPKVSMREGVERLCAWYEAHC